MTDRLHHIRDDFKHRRNLDAYVVALMAFVFAVLSVVGGVLAEELRWAALFAGVGLLVFRITLPETATDRIDELLNDRTAFDSNSLPDRLNSATEVWIFAPSAVNVLSEHHCDILRRGLLGRTDGVLRVVVLDPDAAAAVELATRQLDDSLDFPLQEFGPSLQTTLAQLRLMRSWPITGSLEYRLLSYNPGFSLVALDPSAGDGRVIVEFHAFHNETTSSRMHLELTRQKSEHWYSYWINQFDWIWQTAKQPYQSETATSD